MPLFMFFPGARTLHLPSYTCLASCPRLLSFCDLQSRTSHFLLPALTAPGLASSKHFAGWIAGDCVCLLPPPPTRDWTSWGTGLSLIHGSPEHGTADCSLAMEVELLGSEWDTPASGFTKEPVKDIILKKVYQFIIKDITKNADEQQPDGQNRCLGQEMCEEARGSMPSLDAPPSRSLQVFSYQEAPPKQTFCVLKRMVSGSS